MMLKIKLVVVMCMVMVMASTAMARTIHILPLGDSITQGGRNDREEYTYRWPLFGMLVDAGVEFDFVGSLTNGLHGNAKWPGQYKGRAFDRHHEGHYGWKTAAVREKLPEWSKSWAAAPDIVLIHLGTNDQGAQDFAKEIIQPLEGMIALLRERNPNVAVFVGHLNFNDGAALKIRPLVEEMAKRLNTEQSPVVTVHHYQGWTEKPEEPGADTFDWAHPNPSGQKKMAERWMEAMRPVIMRLQAERQ